MADLSEDDMHGTIANVRRYLHRDGWDTTGLEEEQILGYLDDANAYIEARPAIEQEEQNTDRMLGKIESAYAGALILSSGISELRQTTNESSADGARASYVGGDEGSGPLATTLGQWAADWDESDTLRNESKPTASITTPGGKSWGRSQ